ncbi:MAG TPA: efflux RND transporter periplasmic adaptor subunit [Spongiibacteraceae bacterium]|nr:efflux RND transporter periplasmic adaptor subunit [Spongiibacteraceae bacterium]
MLSKTQKRWLFAIVALMVVLVSFGIATRIQTEKSLQRQVENAAVIVTALKPTVQTGEEELTLPGDVQAYADAPIYARASGYLKSWHVDIGARVKKGQLLAEIDAPEVDQQLLQAEADLATAVANAKLARSTAERWLEQRKADLVSQQETDEKLSDAAAKEALREAARANVARLRELQSFKRIVAPFSGVITARNIDIGALVSAASGVELFRIAASEKLRIYVRVPQNYAPAIKPGLSAELEFAERPNQRFDGTLVRSADAIDNATRTLLAEIEVDNTKAGILPGAYARVHLHLPVPPALRLPVSTLIFRSEGLQVATVDAQQHIRLKSIQLGRDYGTEVEVIAGLQAQDNVVVNPPDAIIEGQSVRVVAPQPETSAEKK